MTTRVFWGEDDHTDRAKGLAAAYATTASKFAGDAATVPGLTRMVLWGHGTADYFCGLRPETFIERIKGWQQANPTLETVEMITCNIRHIEHGTDSYTDKVVTALSRKPNRSVKKLQFRALPVCVTPTGQKCGYSILKWHPRSATWAYIGAPTKNETNHWDNFMFDSVRVLEDFMEPRGSATNYPQALAAYQKAVGKSPGDPYAARHNWTAKDFEDYNRKFEAIKLSTFVAAGRLGTLRWFLEDVK